jgi:uncharacterized protein (DUF488 family)
LEIAMIRSVTPFKLVTLGVYGLTVDAFFRAVQKVKADTFCDIRGRRGVRGQEYAFANSARLQQRLRELGIRYLHFPELAPSAGLRERQATADKAHGIARRKRAALDEEFISGYEKECLAGFDSRKFVEQLGPAARVVVLFCVERQPEACHRSLLAARLQQDLGVKIAHLVPGQPVKHAKNAKGIALGA